MLYYIRLHAASLALWIAKSIAPPVGAQIINSMFAAFRGMPEQMDAGRQGGIIMTYWAITPKGKELGRRQMTECGKTADLVREAHEAENHYLDELLKENKR